MTRFLSYLMAFAVAATTAQSACYADYKAKQNDPLRLHYGVIELNGACAVAEAAPEIQTRIAVDGWTVLTVLTVFDGSQLEQRKESAGEFFLRY